MRRFIALFAVVVVGVASGIWTSGVAAAKQVPFDAQGVVSCTASGKVKLSPGVKTTAQSVTTKIKANLTCTRGSTGRAFVTVVSGKLTGTVRSSTLACSSGATTGADATVKWKALGGKVNRTSIVWSAGALTVGANGVLDFPGPSSSVTGSYSAGDVGLHLSGPGPGTACTAKKGWKGFSFAAATSTVTAAVALPEPEPVGDAFYVPPNPLPPGNPGDVIRSQATTVKLGGVERTDVQAWRVLYRSTSATGAPIAVSGTVIVPIDPYLGPRPIYVYAPPTVGNGDQCATSKALAAGTAPDSFGYTPALNHDWAIAVPDYEGLGTPAQHTYLVGKSQGRATLDAARAATRLTPAGLSNTAPVGIFGYSQGGQSAAWAAQLQPSYAPEIPLVGVAAGGVPSDVLTFTLSKDNTADFGFVVSLLIGYDAAYPELDLNSFLTPEAQTMLATTATQCWQDYVAAHSGGSLAGLTTSNPPSNAAWGARLTENGLGGIAPAVPMFLWHGTTDTLIPYAQGEALNASYCTAGVTVQFAPQPGNHFLAFPQGASTAVSWINDRIQGVTAPDTCS